MFTKPLKLKITLTNLTTPHTHAKSVKYPKREDVSEMSQKKYNQAFKQTVMELYRCGTPAANELTAAEGAEIQKENLRLIQEVKILKKAMTIFVQ